MTPSAPASEAAQLLPEDRLRFDTQNPRIAGEGDVTQDELLATLWQDFAVDELALSIASNGYFQHEPLFATEEDGAYVVIEGNRRLAAVRLLRHAELRRQVGATDLPKITKGRSGELAELPVVVGPRGSVWQYVGFKHVNGPQAWRSHSKAQYIGWVHNELGVPLEDIAKQIGDKHRTVRRLYRALMALEQADAADVFHVEDRARKQFSFSHLYTGLDYSGIQAYLGVDPNKSFKPNPVPKRRQPQLGQFLVWLYGSKSLAEEPLIRSQNPDLRRLDAVLQTKDGQAALERGLGLRVSHEISRGDDALLREALLDARQSLQEARGKLLTGYDGERDLKQVSEQILQLAETIDDEMASASSEREKKRRRERAKKRAAASSASK